MRAATLSSIQVPWEWEHRVCTCPDPKYGKWGDEQGFVGKICTACEKYFRWVLLRCGGCSENYLRLFAHPETCPHTNLCLNCLNSGHKRKCQSCPRFEFSDYKFDIDRAPRPVPNASEVLESFDPEAMFDF